MPNHVFNVLTICTEDKEKYREIRNAIKGENGAIDFESICPMPEILDNTNRDDYAWIAEAVSKQKAGHPLCNVEQTRVDEYRKMNKEEKAKVNHYLERFNECGACDWYDWRIANWGTKWNAYEILTEEQYHDEQHSIEFQTAWSMPEEIYIALSKMFYDITFEVEYADEDLGQNCGRVSFLNGESEYEFYGAGSEEDVKFACELWGYDYDEYKSEIEEVEE